MSGIQQVNNVRTSKSNSNFLESKLKEIEDKQGIFGKAWNGLKEMVNIGTTESECESMLAKYKNGEISFEEAAEYLNSFEQKQDNATELVKNIATGTGAIAFATLTAGTGLGFLAALQAGAPIGAAIKTTMGVVDRATNGVDDDELNAKDITKDVISGAVTGMTSAVASGVGAGIKAGCLKTSIANGTKCGLECGAIAGSTSYLTDTALEEDKEFNFGDLTRATVASSLVSGTVGGIVGAGLFKGAQASGNVGKTIEKSTAQTIVDDSTSSTTRKVLGRVFKNYQAAVA
jgi:hypothetical protein